MLLAFVNLRFSYSSDKLLICKIDFIVNAIFRWRFAFKHVLMYSPLISFPVSVGLEIRDFTDFPENNNYNELIIIKISMNMTFTTRIIINFAHLWGCWNKSNWSPFGTSKWALYRYHLQKLICLIFNKKRNWKS